MARSLSAYGAKMYAEMQLAIAETYGVPLSSKMFSVEPSIAQELNDAITAKADFLQRINVIPVTEIKGEKVFIGVSGPVTGRTNTKTTDREAKDASELENSTYELSSTESDVGLPYAKIDAWAKFPDFHQRYSAAVQKQIALDRIMVGFHGLKAAAQTDIETYPMLQDVNKGWLQQLREQAPQQVLKEGKEAGKVTLGPNGDYANLDALVHDTKQMVDERLRDGGDLIAIIGTDLLAADKAKLYAKQGDTPTEKERIEDAQVIATYGGLPSFSVPFFPVNGVLVTSWDNLSIYFQDSSWRKQTVDNPKRSRVEDYNSRNEGYVIEQLEKIALTENVELLK
ncbi:phage major capsid protein, P2 family [Pseudomonas granadensis]|jgi:P2 family phage major capsid protein|uniref:phage major capsid protein, P2 family n=1 Tax=Pseudomonas TaxID=286 RepID=UPI0019D0C99D|nr:MULTISPECIES: phage major capsid protein, P2 family [Pseudomonas fluorescens group]MBN6773684.1 phage major capsid protein, P2 family [Pseudomonas granadensis]MBN6804987.1 phage major capsid protein, P2 family [Pseudomonas granadensis]MBN6832133.1 phage major capsid protein, P2 family [Pseudomonas granadensis]MBN6838758.1 phage major capsid protein, P2 family [Pseudomonas granadensis]MBN6867095.1 phage major capsid protein, P2 family [Pseudomonas granadensis]